jgi:hypothetical protein
MKKVLIKIRNVCIVGNTVHSSFHSVLFMISHIPSCVLVLEYASVSLLRLMISLPQQSSYFLKLNSTGPVFSVVQLSTDFAYYKIDRLDKDSNF